MGGDSRRHQLLLLPFALFLVKKKKGPSPVLGMSMMGKWVPVGPESNHVALPSLPAKHLVVYFFIVSPLWCFIMYLHFESKCLGIWLSFWENTDYPVFAFEHKLWCPILLPSLEFGGPVHYPLDNGELPPTQEMEIGCELTVWRSLLALLWIHCLLKQQGSPTISTEPLLWFKPGVKFWATLKTGAHSLLLRGSQSFLFFWKRT